MNTYTLKRLAFVSTVATIVTASSVAIYYHLLGEKNVTQIHRLEFPLMLTGSGAGGHNYLLPKGTTLYYEQAFPEGFIRYKIYVNVEGIDLKSTTLDDPTLIEPISAYPVGSMELRKLLLEYPLSKDELASLLQSGQLSKDEIRELLTEFAK